MNLREARFKSGKTQWTITLLTRINQTRISLLENNFVIPSLKEKLLISEVLGLSVDDIAWPELEVRNGD